MQPEQEQEIIHLRTRKLTPKQIARKLGLKVSEVTAVVKAQAEQATLMRIEKGELDPIAQCLVNTNCAKILLESNAEERKKLEKEGAAGLGCVLVARTFRNRLKVCTYLVDYWCLGVKDAIEPRQLGAVKYENFLKMVYARFPDGYQDITLEQAQAIVLGAVDYAAKLGLQPHADFEKARSHLGQWDDQLQLEFGRDGKPFYISGPYDDPQKIVSALRENVGEGNYDFIAGMEPTDKLSLPPGFWED
ncbi:MAG: DNA-binding response regulator [Cyanothece sp. SIO1E1]|nr:DNA-binding response regulator [Cyanothece sp. SIO1E1]